MIDLIKVSIETQSIYLDALTKAIKEIGLSFYFTRLGKIVRLKSSSKARDFFSTENSIIEIQAAYLWFYAPETQAKRILEFILHASGLDTPGKASSTLSSVSLLVKNHIIMHLIQPLKEIPPSPPLMTTNQLMGIHCIVPRGLGIVVARAALELGLCVPVTWYAMGQGDRGRLGMLRIALKPEKEIVQLVVPDHDAPGVLETIITDAKLAQPGKGFISVYNIEEGIVNSRTLDGKQFHLASMEQIIHAIDSREGNTLWRRKFDHGSYSKFKYGKDLMSITVYAPEGLSADLSQAAMSIGAPGATSSLVQAYSLTENLKILHAQEETLIVSKREKAKEYAEFMFERVIQTDPHAIIELQARPMSYVYTS